MLSSYLKTFMRPSHQLATIEVREAMEMAFEFRYLWEMGLPEHSDFVAPAPHHPNGYART
jgi:hypothetical protein